VLAILSIGLWALPTVWIFTGLSHSVFTLNKGVCQLGPESNWNTLAFICILKTLDEDLKFVGFRQPAPLRSLPFSFANFDNNLRPMTLRSSQIRTGRQCYVHNRRQIGCSQAVPASFALVCAQRLNFFASHPNFELMKAPISSFISSCRHNQSSRQKRILATPLARYHIGKLHSILATSSPFEFSSPKLYAWNIYTQQGTSLNGTKQLLFFSD
jgi:hypothetical protein